MLIRCVGLSVQYYLTKSGSGIWHNDKMESRAVVHIDIMET